MGKNVDKNGKKFYIPKPCILEGCEEEKDLPSYYCEKHVELYGCKVDGCNKVINPEFNELLCNNHRKAAARWGWSTEEYIQKKSLSACEICGVKQINLFIDHNHSCCPSGKGCPNCFRGMLCNKCNSGLGSFKDDPVLLKKAIEYLKRA